MHDATSRVAAGARAEVVGAAVRRARISHAVIVPDTHQQTVPDRVDRDGLPVIRCATPSDALSVCVGLWMVVARCEPVRPSYPAGWLDVSPTEECRRVRTALRNDREVESRKLTPSG
jgi:hypothetical protein